MATRDAKDYALRTKIETNQSISAYTPPTLEANDLIVEKMHIHYGQKGKNPVDNLRFYPKFSIQGVLGQEKGKQIMEKTYETLLPRVFEEKSLRVFCKDS